MPTTRSLLARAALAAACGLGGAGTVQAAVYTGSWDPNYGGIFPDLGWKATATFDIPNACLGQADGTYGIGGKCAGFSVLSAQVDFFNWTADRNPLTSPVVGSFALNPAVIVTGIDIAGGQLAGIDTGFFDYFVPTGPAAAIAGNGNYSFSLLLYGGDQAQLIYANPITTSPGCAFIAVRGASCGVSVIAAEGVFAPAAAVPEPGTWALLFAGLGVLGLTARRKRRTA